MRAWMLVVLVGCGDNTFPGGGSLEPAANLTIVAHQDDDLLFMQPDELDAALGGEGLTNVYVTAGNGRDGLGKAVDRYAGLMAAYTAATGKSGWSCASLEIAGHAVELCRLADTRLSLLFLGYPDGGKQGEYPESLLRLWEGSIERATSVGHVDTSYDRAELIEVLATVIATTQPRAIRTLEIASNHGRDHSDHMLTGALTLLAVAAAGSPAELTSYRGYATDIEPENVTDALYDRSERILAHYDACVDGCAECGQACPTISEAHTKWLHRRYGVGRRISAGGELRMGATCATPMTDGEVILTDCTAPASWELSAEGLLHVGDRCIQALPTGELVAGHDCSAIAANHFVLDDEGHLWLGAPPFPAPDMALAHLQCIGVSGGRLRGSLCGADHAPSWTFTRAPVTTPRSSLGLVASGRAVQLADFDNDGLADLCAVEGDRLRCVHGLGTGSFAGVLELPFAVEPESLVIGDLDGDQLRDACGRDAAGILCTDAATTTRRWTPVFARTGAPNDTDRSLAAIDRKICGVVEPAGLICAGQSTSAITEVRSSWAARAQYIWQADLDGDLRGDWCVLSDMHVFCGLAAQRAVTTDGAPWAFSLGGTVDPAPLADISALADVDRDGRADLCSIRDGRILCQRGQGHGFGPASVFANLPVGPAATALWLGDLDGDHRADACVDQGSSIVCFRAP